MMHCNAMRCDEMNTMHNTNTNGDGRTCNGFDSTLIILILVLMSFTSPLLQLECCTCHAVTTIVQHSELPGKRKITR